MSDHKITEKHVRECRIIIGRHKLARLIEDHVLAATGFSRDASKLEIVFDDEMEGSPGYRVGTRCVVKLVEDQMLLPKEGKADE